MLRLAGYHNDITRCFSCLITSFLVTTAFVAAKGP